MADRCVKCGCPDSAESRLVDEWMPFLGRRKYCPHCLNRLHGKVFFGLAGLTVALCLYGFLTGTRLRVPILWLAIFQWLMLVPHELGHAVTARLLGFKDIRIWIGSGEPVWAFDLFGFRWLINSIPFGGFTVPGEDAPPSRWRHVAMTLAGPAVSLLGMLFSWMATGGLGLPDINTLWGAFFWANAVVALQTLIPYDFQHEGHIYPNDGLIVLRLLCPWISCLNEGAGRRVAGRIVKAIGFCVVLAISAGSAWLTFKVFTNTARDFTGFAKALSGSFFLVFTIATGYLSWRILIEPLSDEVKQESSEFQAAYADLAKASNAIKDEKVSEELTRIARDSDDQIKLSRINNLLDRFPGDPWVLLFKADVELALGELAGALVTLRSIPREISDAVSFAISLYELTALVRLGDFKAAEALCERWYEPSVPLEKRVTFCDAFGSYITYEGRTEAAARGEKWIRRGLELDPENASLKATLGGLLVEQGKYAEAKPLLVPRVARAPSPQNKAFACFYLGLLEQRQGNAAAAASLFKRAVALSDADWMIKRIEEEQKVTTANVVKEGEVDRAFDVDG